MKFKNLKVIFFVLLGFSLNIFLYLESETYKNFLHSFDSNKYNVNDDFSVNLDNIVKQDTKKTEESIFSGLKDDFDFSSKKYEKNIGEQKKEKKVESHKKSINKNSTTNYKVEFKQKKDEVKITNIEKEILNKLKEFNLKQVEIQGRLFGITSEYPNKYFEYYNKSMNLYLFGNETYKSLKNIFSVLTYELPIKINEVNNFGKKSFYINMDKMFDDGYVRIVLEYKTRTFGLKVKKDFYEKIKTKLYIYFKEK